ncbi:MAG: flagellin, partial [Clostridiales bacterium]|nr:flagellin [Clostridiales bacterium]
MRINNNLMAMNTHRQLGLGNTAASKSMEKLSSGYRINRAGDDAAGLSISEKMRGQIRGLMQASSNAQDGISLIQTAEGALQETHAILQRMRELAVQSANDTNVDVDRAAIQGEIDELAAEITRIAENTEFNTQNLLGGKFEGKFHIRANAKQNVSLSINDMSASALQVAGPTGASFAIEVKKTGLSSAQVEAYLGEGTY